MTLNSLPGAPARWLYDLGQVTQPFRTSFSQLHAEDSKYSNLLWLFQASHQPCEEEHTAPAPDHWEVSPGSAVSWLCDLREITLPL